MIKVALAIILGAASLLIWLPQLIAFISTGEGTAPTLVGMPITFAYGVVVALLRQDYKNSAE